MTAPLGSLQQKVIDIMALTGDAVDNVPGCPGVGKVTAAKLINRWQSLDALYLSVITGFHDAVLTERLARLLWDNMEKVFLSRELVRLDWPLPEKSAIFVPEGPWHPAESAGKNKFGRYYLVRKPS